MPNERVSMSKLKQLIGLQSSNFSVRALSRALGLSVGAVSKCVARDTLSHKNAYMTSRHDGLLVQKDRAEMDGYDNPFRDSQSA
jgi:hypothetical protein